MKRFIIFLAALSAIAAGMLLIAPRVRAQSATRSVELRVFAVTADPSTCLPNRFYIQNTSSHLFMGLLNGTCVDIGVVVGTVSKSPTADQTITGGHGLINTGGFTGPLTGAVTGNVTGNLTGNVIGNVTGNLTGLATGARDAQTVFTTGSNQSITVKTGTALLTKGSAGTYALANPTAGTDDGKILFLQSTTAFAHVVTTGSSGVNATNNTLTFGGAIGDGIVLEAYNGSWYVRATINVTASTV